MAKNQFLNWKNVQNCQKCNFTKKIFDLFDFTSFFAWTFLNFLARCVLPSDPSPPTLQIFWREPFVTYLLCNLPEGCFLTYQVSHHGSDLLTLYLLLANLKMRYIYLKVVIFLWNCQKSVWEPHPPDFRCAARRRSRSRRSRGGSKKSAAWTICCKS